MKTLRSLKPGERIPDNPPKRYRTGGGYYRLRWRIAPNTYVEAYEHRVVDGYITTAQHVHHIDHDKTNNEPGNLRFVTVADHNRHHRSIDRAKVVSLYAEGFSTPEIGKKLGCNAATAYRILVEQGVAPRSISESLRYDINTDLVTRLHGAGVRAKRIARVLNVSPIVISGIIKRENLTPHKPGRPTNQESKRALETLRRENLI